MATRLGSPLLVGLKSDEYPSKKHIPILYSKGKISYVQKEFECANLVRVNSS